MTVLVRLDSVTDRSAVVGTGVVSCVAYMRIQLLIHGSTVFCIDIYILY